MPTVQPTPVAIACADLHLSHKPPAARRDDWYRAQAIVMQEIEQLSYHKKLPVLFAGDLFHYHNPPPELINLALAHLPVMYAIPGQHDLPHHQYDALSKSAFWTLMKAGRIKCISPEGAYITDQLWVQGFGWGQEVQPPKDNNCKLNIALVHEYLWVGNCRYMGAPESQSLGNNYGKFRGYDVVIIGDNHIAWDYLKRPECQEFFNCGSLMRRNTDQNGHRPRVGIIMSDGHVEIHYLDISQDKLDVFSGEEGVGPEAVGFADVMNELRNLSGATLDFAALLRQAMEQKGTDPRVAKYLMEALENGDPDRPKTR